MYARGREDLGGKVKLPTAKKTSFSITEGGQVQRYTQGSDLPDLIPSSLSMSKSQATSREKDSKLTFHLPQIVNPSKV